MHEFYVTLRSNAHLEEFPDNTCTAFKARLPQALNFKDEAWDVALCLIIIPLLDDGFTVNWLLHRFEKMKPGNNLETIWKQTFVFHQTFWKEVPIPNGKQWKKDEVTASFIHSSDSDVIRTGTELMAYLLDQIIQSIALNTKTGENYFFEDGHFSVSQFHWTTNGVKVLQLENKGNNNKAAHVRFAVNTTFAKIMGWFIENRDGSFRMGPNLEILKQVYPVPQGHEQKWEVITKSHLGIWTSKMIALSPFCTWHFKNLDEAFHRFVGQPPQSMVVYSDVAGSRVVGSDIVNALREVNYQHRGYVEPRHLQYVPVQNKIVETIETTLKSTTGNTPLLEQGTTSITLHFRKRIKGSTLSERANSFSSCVEEV